MTIGLPRELYETLLVKWEAGSKEFLDPNFPQQNEFVMDRSRFVAAQCSRRAGKSNGLALKYFKALQDHPGSFCPYVALTRESARNIMWPVLQEQDETFKVGFRFTESDLTMTHPNGARLQLFGADMKNFIRRLKGVKTPGAAIDEAQDFGAHLESLVDDVLTPALTDYKDSWLAITGTPGPVPHGYFFDITEQRKFGFSLHKWTLLDNPYINGKDFVNEIKTKHGWDDANPTYLREYCNKWVLDKRALLIDYDPNKNHFDLLPHHKWNYILGVDLGLRDSDALAVLGWSETCSDIYLVEEIITSDQDITALQHQIEDLMRRYDIQKIVMDTGGLGAKIAEEFTRRKHIPVQAADKKRKFENVTFLNDWLRLGKFKARKTSKFAKDANQLQIDWEKTTPDRLVVRDTFHSDIIDSVLYAFKESPAFTYRDPPKTFKIGTPEWQKREAEDMERRAEEHFAEQAEKEKGSDWNW